MKECQGDHGRYGANYRCCLPALAGFVSPHSMGPDRTILCQVDWGFKDKGLENVFQHWHGIVQYAT